jgi:enoyl-CoA hydratase/carnithine racemase
VTGASEIELPLIVERDGGVLLLTLNRPSRLNALTSELIQMLGGAICDARDDDEIRVIVITGAGDRAFCSGTDLKDGPSVSGIADQLSSLPIHLSRGLEVFKPIVAAINGYALGGGLELALACDLRVASSSASFGFPEVGIGSIPGAGGTQRVIRQIPRALAMRMLLVGDRVGAELAQKWGLVSDVYAADELRGEAMRLAKRIASNAPLSTQAIKQAVSLGADLPLSEAMRFERAIFNLLRDTEDRVEGREAFREKRAPRFTGR